MVLKVTHCFNSSSYVDSIKNICEKWLYTL